MELNELRLILQGDPATAKRLKELADGRTQQQREKDQRDERAYLEICDMVDKLSNTELRRLEPMLDSLRFAFQDESLETGRYIKKASDEPSQEHKAFLEFVRRFGG